MVRTGADAQDASRQGEGGKRARKGERGYESEMYRPAPRRLALVGGMLVVAILALVAACGAPSVPSEGPLRAPLLVAQDV